MERKTLRDSKSKMNKTNKTNNKENENESTKDKDKDQKSNMNSSNLPLINSPSNNNIIDKRIYIHQPSDFLKNKYTFFGNLSNNKEILSKNSRKTYHSPKFDYNDINKQMKQGNQIIGSIIKEEKDLLPNLLKNYIMNFTDKNSTVKNPDEYISHTNHNNTKSRKKFKNDFRTFSSLNNKDIYSYKNNLKRINQKSERLVSLNFLVSSPKKMRSNYENNKNNYYQFLGSPTPDRNINISNNYNFNPNDINYQQQQRNFINNLNNINVNRGPYNPIESPNNNRITNINLYRY